MVGRRIVAAIAAIGDDARQAGSDLRLDFGNDGLQRMAVVGVARQRLGVGDELAALGMMERCGDADLDPKLIRAMRLALADAFDLRSVQRIDLRPPLVLALLAHSARQHQRHAEDFLQRRVALDPAQNVARHPSEVGAQHDDPQYSLRTEPDALQRGRYRR